MLRINVVIADSDEFYILSVGDFIRKNHGHMFKISSYTSKEELAKYIFESDERIDILLVSPDFFRDEFINYENRIGLVILFSEGRLNRRYHGCEIISKFTPGDKLLGGIIRMFSEKSDNLFVTRGRRAKVYSFYSPSGGSGNTSVCYGSAVISAKQGQRVFYLNLETIASTTYLFDSKHDMTLSHLFYLTREKRKNYALTIEVAKKEDRETGIRFFSPPDCMFENFDLKSDEYKEFLENLVFSDNEDVVFVDLPTDLHYNMMPFITECDKIFVVSKPEINATLKEKKFLNDISMVESKEKRDIKNRIVKLLNMTKSDDNTKIYEGYDFFIPYDENIYRWEKERAFININSNFGAGLKLIYNYLNDK